MIGIYKITNKNNGKSYIGQSIHCGKRLDEHSKGSQLIDEVIQLEGIENFNFEILKEVEKEELSYWEDYYIIKFGTMFPNGYNKKWNCNRETREEIEKEILKERKENKVEEKISMGDSIIEDKDFFLEENELTGNLFKTYIGLFFNSICKEKIYFINKNKNPVSKLSKMVKLTEKTYKKYFLELKRLNLIKENNDRIYIENLKEITNFINIEEYEKFNYKELYILWKIRSENVLGIKDFYLYELYWNGGKKKLSCPVNNEIKEILNTLQENQKIIVKIDRDSDGKCKAIQIISI